jgi:hypothetical protein
MLRLTQKSKSTSTIQSLKKLQFSNTPIFFDLNVDVKPICKTVSLSSDRKAKVGSLFWYCSIRLWYISQNKMLKAEDKAMLSLKLFL